MRIGINGRFLLQPHTGIGQYTLNLLNAMAREDRSVEWVIATPAPIFDDAVEGIHLPKGAEILVVPEKPFPSASLKKAYWEKFQMPHALAKANVDLIHHPYPVPFRIPHRSQSQKTPPKILVTIHDIIPWLRPEYRTRLRSRLYHRSIQKSILRADHLIVVSRTTAQDLEDFFSAQNPNAFRASTRGKIPLITVIHEAAANLFAKRTRQHDHPRPYLIYSGGYDPRKNVNRLIEAYQEYVAPRHEIDLILVGAEGLDERQKQNPRRLIEPIKIPEIKDHSLDALIQRGKVHFTPPLLQEELSSHLRGSLAMVHMSLAEGFNLPLLEAAVCGIPLIVSDIPIHREIVGDDALYADPFQTKSIGETLIHFLNTPELSDKFKEGSMRIAERYSWKASAGQTLALYQKLLA